MTTMTEDRAVSYARAHDPSFADVTQYVMGKTFRDCTAFERIKVMRYVRVACADPQVPPHTRQRLTLSGTMAALAILRTDSLTPMERVDMSEAAQGMVELLANSYPEIATELSLRASGALVCAA